MFISYLRALLTRASFPKSSPSLSWHTTPLELIENTQFVFLDKLYDHD